MKMIVRFATFFACAFLIILYPRETTVSQEIFSEATLNGLTNVGYAPFNLTSPRFNCSGFLASLKPFNELHISFLYNTFGNDFSCLNKLLADSRLKTLDINLINEPGHRNGRLGKYEFLYDVGTVNQYDQKLRKRDRRLKRKFDQYVRLLQDELKDNLRPHTSLVINPGLESNISVAAARVLVRWSRDAFPDARIVWNPFVESLTRRHTVDADLIEGHGLYPRLKAPCFYNMDGTDVKYNNRPALGESEGIKNYFHSGAPLFQQLEKYANLCEVAFLWTQESNGLSYKEGFKDPRTRSNRTSTEMYKQIMGDILQIHRRGRIAPMADTYSEEDDSIVSSCSVVSSNFEDGLKSGRLLKQSEFPDRGGVIILPQSYGSVNRIFLVKGSRVIDTFNGAGTYHDGRKTFRSKISPTRYPFNTYLVFDSNSIRYCFKIPNPRIRLD